MLSFNGRCSRSFASPKGRFSVALDGDLPDDNHATTWSCVLRVPQTVPADMCAELQRKVDEKKLLARCLESMRASLRQAASSKRGAEASSDESPGGAKRAKPS